MTGKLTTHVLNIGGGRPAQGMIMDLYQISDARGKLHLCSARTNADGRLNGALLEGEGLHEGIYELAFHAGVYFREQGQNSGTPSIWEEIPIRFTILDRNEHYHIPLLIAPGGCSTYGGS